MKNKNAIIIVNAVTMTRVIGTFLMPIIWIYMTPSGLLIYIMSLLLTDLLDGFLARKLHACTIFGSLLDQTADKLLGVATLAVLAQSSILMLLPILTEVTITIVTTRGAIKGGSSDSSILGKIKTFTLGLIIVSGFATVYAKDIIRLFDGSTALGQNLIDFFNKVSANQLGIMNSLAFIAVGSGIMVAADYALRAKSDVKKVKESGLKPEEIKLKKGKDLLYALFSEEYYQKTKKEPIIKRLGVSKK